MSETVSHNIKRKGVFTGTFDPFTIGHKDIVVRAVGLFDQLTICICHNEAKHFQQTTQQRKECIERIFANDSRITVDVWDGLTVDYCKLHDINYIVKGVRNTRDFEYERDQAEMNRHLSGVETILLYSDPSLAAVSSSLVKVLESYGRDVSEFLP